MEHGAGGHRAKRLAIAANGGFGPAFPGAQKTRAGHRLLHAVILLRGIAGTCSHPGKGGRLGGVRPVCRSHCIEPVKERVPRLAAGREFAAQPGDDLAVELRQERCDLRFAWKNFWSSPWRWQRGKSVAGIMRVCGGAPRERGDPLNVDAGVPRRTGRPGR